MAEILLKLDSITQYFSKDGTHKQKILDHINLQIKSGEIVAILGKSGSGKSTLLRIIAGLNEPSQGKVKFSKPRSLPLINMVFQNFALFPWLDVLQNVELALTAKKPIDYNSKNLALDSINLIGLKGFESAMPRELSGGMKQRVGFARGLVSNPDILLLDEPFSALDVLTANTLKNDFMQLWRDKKTSLKSVILVTHSIEEAVLMADKIIILGDQPARIIEDIKVNLPYPRNIKNDKFQKIVEKIYSHMTNVNNISLATKSRNKHKPQTNDISLKIPLASPNDIVSLIELLNSKEHKGEADIADLVTFLGVKLKSIFNIIEALAILKFVAVLGGRIKITKIGKLFCKADAVSRKEIFTKQLTENVPLANYICNKINERPEHKVPKKRFKIHLEDYMSSEEASSSLTAIIAWGRYSEIFFYDDNKQVFIRENKKNKNSL